MIGVYILPISRLEKLLHETCHYCEWPKSRGEEPMADLKIIFDAHVCLWTEESKTLDDGFCFGWAINSENKSILKY